MQATLVEALAELAAGPVRVTGAGRTDAGVHAEGQVAAAELDTRLDAATLQRALNAKLPPDLAVRAAASAPAGFDPRRQAKGKLYRYQVWNGPEPSPLRRRRFHHVREAVDVERTGKASAPLAGRHDFASFRAAGSAVGSTVRTLTRVTVSGAPGGEILFEFEGDGFLRHMVRTLVGTLLEVGHGRRPPDSIPELLAVCDRRWAGATAPAVGLTLVRVDY